MREKLINILNDLRPDIEFENSRTLIDDGLLDSFDVINLIGELNDAFSIEISVEDILPQNFNSIDKMLSLIERLKAE